MFSATRKICPPIQSFHVGVNVIVVNKTHSSLPHVTLNNRSLPRISTYGQLTTTQVLITKLQMCTGGGNTNKQLWRSQPQVLVIVKNAIKLTRRESCEFCGLRWYPLFLPFPLFTDVSFVSVHTYFRIFDIRFSIIFVIFFFALYSWLIFFTYIFYCSLFRLLFSAFLLSYSFSPWVRILS
jgi:hypothetical protein